MEHIDIIEKQIDKSQVRNKYDRSQEVVLCIPEYWAQHATYQCTALWSILLGIWNSAGLLAKDFFDKFRKRTHSSTACDNIYWALLLTPDCSEACKEIAFVCYSHCVYILSSIAVVHDCSKSWYLTELLLSNLRLNLLWLSARTCLLRFAGPSLVGTVKLSKDSRLHGPPEEIVSNRDRRLEKQKVGTPATLWTNAMCMKS